MHQTKQNKMYTIGKYRFWNWYSNINYCTINVWVMSGGSDGKESACNARDSGSIPGLGRPLEKGMATHSRVLAWRIPWTEEPDGLQSMRSQRVRHDWSDLARTHTCAYTVQIGNWAHRCSEVCFLWNPHWHQCLSRQGGKTLLYSSAVGLFF